MSYDLGHSWMWRFGLPGWAETVWILPEGVVHDDPDKEPWEKEFTDAFLGDWGTDSDARRTLADLHLATFGYELTLDDEIALAEQLPDLRAALREGRLVIWGYRRCAVTAPAVLPNQRPIVRPEPKVKTWIEIVLLDQDGRPVGREPYQLTLPDGATRSGNLDDNGFVRVEGIVPGSCDVSFPKIDAREWWRAN